MTEKEIYDTLTGIFRDVLDDDTVHLTASTSAADIPEWDSFNHVNIVVASEMKLGVKFTTGELDGLRNVGDFVVLIQKKLGR